METLWTIRFVQGIAIDYIFCILTQAPCLGSTPGACKVLDWLVGNRGPSFCPRDLHELTRCHMKRSHDESRAGENAMPKQPQWHSHKE